MMKNILIMIPIAKLVNEINVLHQILAIKVIINLTLMLMIKLYKIIKTLLNAYEKYPCHKYYQNIEHIYDYLIREKNEIELIQIKHENELSKMKN